MSESEEVSNYKFRTKRERQRQTPYSRPQNAIPNRNETHFQTNDANSLLSRIGESVKTLLMPNWLRHTTNYLHFNYNSGNNSDNQTVVQTEQLNSIDATISGEPFEPLVRETDNRTEDGLPTSDRLWQQSVNNSDRQSLNRIGINWPPITTTSVTDSVGNRTDVYLPKPSTSSTLFSSVTTTGDELRQSTHTLSSDPNRAEVIDALEADDRSSSSSTTASSTSGCSSLVPSHSDNVSRIGGMSLETIGRERTKFKNKETEEKVSTIDKSFLTGDRNQTNPLINSLNNFNKRKTNFIISKNNAKQFSLENFITPSSILQKKSNFYDGKTVFGGTNLTRAARLAGTTPYSLSQRPHLVPVLKVDVKSKRLDSSDGLSSCSRRILQTLEKESTPLRDAKRVPYSAAMEFKDYFNSSQYLLRSSKRPRVGPPTAQTPVLSQATIDHRFQPLKYELRQKGDNKRPSNESTDELINSCDNIFKSSVDSKINESNDTKSNETFGGKMLRKDTKREERRPKVQPIRDESVSEDLNALANVEPLRMPTGASLPKFNFGNSSSFEKQSNSSKTLSTTTVTKVGLTEDSALVFKFAEPVLEKREKNIGNTSESVGDARSKPVFSSPIGAITQKPTISLKTIEKESNILNKCLQKSDELTTGVKSRAQSTGELKKSDELEGKWVCVCLFWNRIADTKCKACSKERDSQVKQSTTVSKSHTNVKPIANMTTNAPMITTNWGDRFKAPTGSWNCAVCMLNNSADRTTCNACEVPKPAPKAVATTAPIVPNTWGDKFKPPTGSWNCAVCSLNNSTDRTKCIACEEPKPGVKNTTKETKSLTNVWKCYYCKEDNDSSKSICTSCGKIKTAIATKEGLDVLYSNDKPFKFGFTNEKSEIKKDIVLETGKSTTDKTDFPNKSISTNSLFSNSTETTSQSLTSNPISSAFAFGSTAPLETPKFSTETQGFKLTDNTTTTTSTGQPFKFGAPGPSKPIADIKPTEKSTTSTVADIFGSSKTNSPALFQFGTQPSTTGSSETATTTDRPVTTDPSQPFLFGAQSNDLLKTKKTVSFAEKPQKERIGKTSDNLSTTETTTGFQFPKSSAEEMPILFKGFSSSPNSSLFGSTTTAANSPVTTVTTASISPFVDNKFSPQSNETQTQTQTKSIGSLFGLPATTSSSLTSFSTPFSMNNKFNSGLTSTTSIGSIGQTTSGESGTKNIFSLTPSTIKSFDSMNSNNLSQTNRLESSSATPTAPLSSMTSSSQQKNPVFGNPNTNLQSGPLKTSTVASKSNFSFGGNTGANTSTSGSETNIFDSTNKSLFGSGVSNKGFAFGGNTSMTSSQTGFSFNPTTNSISSTSSVGFGLNSNSNRINTTTTEATNTKPTTNSLFSFGQTSEQFPNSLTQKPINTSNSNPINSSQFGFGVTPNQTTGQTNSANLFGNAINPGQSTSLSFSQTAALASTANSPFAFGSVAFGTPQSTPSVPQIQAQPQQPLPPPQFNFSQQPSFEFGSMASAGAQPGAPVFQFSAEPPAQAANNISRNFKKAKRRLNPT